jgi:hypothetical protein
MLSSRTLRLAIVTLQRRKPAPRRWPGLAPHCETSHLKRDSFPVQAILSLHPRVLALPGPPTRAGRNHVTRALLRSRRYPDNWRSTPLPLLTTPLAKLEVTGRSPCRPSPSPEVAVAGPPPGVHGGAPDVVERPLPQRRWR